MRQRSPVDGVPFALPVIECRGMCAWGRPSPSHFLFFIYFFFDSFLSVVSRLSTPERRRIGRKTCRAPRTNLNRCPKSEEKRTIVRTWIVCLSSPATIFIGIFAQRPKEIVDGLRLRRLSTINKRCFDKEGNYCNSMKIDSYWID